MKSYVVHLIDSEEPHPLKHFGARNTATAFANMMASERKARRADVYEVDTDDAGAAVTAVTMGEGVLVDSRGERLSEAEQERTGRLKRLRGLRWEDLWPAND